MAIASIEELCKGISEISGLAAPVLAPDDEGKVSFTMHTRGVAVSVLQFRNNSAGTVFLCGFRSWPTSRFVGAKVLSRRYRREALITRS